MVFSQHDFLLDGATQLKDAGAVAATADGAVASATVTIDLGAAGTFTRGVIVIDTTTCVVNDTDEVYEFQACVSDTAVFTTRYITARKSIGAASPTGHPVATAAVGRHVLYFDNVADTSATTQSATPMRYLRLRCVVAGTSPSCNYVAWFVPLP